MNALEKAALDDPFLADALEGYGAASINAADELSDLERKLKQRIAGATVVSLEPRGSFKWWKVAAAVIIIGGVGFFTFRLSTSNTNKEVAAVEEKKKSNDQPQLSVPANDSNKSATPETTSIAISEKQKKPKTEATRQQPGQSDALLSPDTTSKDIVANAAAPVSAAPLNLKQEKNDSAGRPTSIANPREDFAKAKMPVRENRKSAAPSAMQQQELGIRDQQKMNYFYGSVVDRHNNPLPFANITNAKDNAETYADVKGNFTLLSPDSALEVQVRSVGFESNLARLKNNVAANQVILQEDKTLKEITTTGYAKSDDVSSRMSTMPSEETAPVDGWSNYNLYLANNINVPADLKKKISAGRQVELSFNIDQNGNPVDIRVEKSLCKECDEEAIRVVKDGPKWRKQGKKAERVTFSVPFNISR